MSSEKYGLGPLRLILRGAMTDTGLVVNCWRVPGVCEAEGLSREAIPAAGSSRVAG